MEPIIQKRRVKGLLISADELVLFLRHMDGESKLTQCGMVCYNADPIPIPDDAKVVGVTVEMGRIGFYTLLVYIESESFEEVQPYSSVMHHTLAWRIEKPVEEERDANNA